MHIIIHIIIYFNGILFCSSIPISMGDSTELEVLWESVVEVKTWLSLQTECLACCSCVESWEMVYCLMLAYDTAERWPRLAYCLRVDTLVRAVTSSPLIACISLGQIGNRKKPIRETDL